MNPSEDTCPRCGRGFHCGAAEPAPCPCGTLRLDPAVLAELRQRYEGCLCLACLVELGGTTAAPWPPHPPPGSPAAP